MYWTRYIKATESNLTEGEFVKRAIGDVAAYYVKPTETGYMTYVDALLKAYRLWHNHGVEYWNCEIPGLPEGDFGGYEVL